VSSATINRFFSLHFTLPFVLVALVAGHLLYLHISGSSNPVGTTSNADRTAFHPYFSFKDLVTVYLFFVLFTVIIFYMPDKLGQLWPLFFIYLFNYINNMKYAVCWKYLIVLKQLIYYKTIIISCLTVLIIIIINTFFYLNILYLNSLDTNIVKYYSRKYNQQVTKGEYNSVSCIRLVGTSETLRVQKRKINSLIKSDFKNHDKNSEIKFNQ
jgi:ubiquinol-cytochrome c reductase cytochrome b subunit